MGKVQRVQELRRSNAATPIRNKKRYRRDDFNADMSLLREEQFHIGEAPDGTVAGASKQ
jgi:hypothetical protein